MTSVMRMPGRILKLAGPIHIAAHRDRILEHRPDRRNAQHVAALQRACRPAALLRFDVDGDALTLIVDALQRRERRIRLRRQAAAELQQRRAAVVSPFSS